MIEFSFPDTNEHDADPYQWSPNLFIWLMQRLLWAPQLSPTDQHTTEPTPVYLVDAEVAVGPVAESHGPAGPTQLLHGDHMVQVAHVTP